MEETKGKKTTNSPSWIGTSIRVTAQLYSLAGWIGTSTRPNSIHNDDRGEKAQPQLPPTIALLRLSKQLKCSSVDRGAEGANTTTPRGHCRAGPNTAVLLHPNRPPDGLKNTKSRATQRAEASPLPPLDDTLACAGTSNPQLSKSLSCAGISNPPHGTTLCTRFRDCCRGSKKKKKHTLSN